jgi:hypothetical protein
MDAVRKERWMPASKRAKTRGFVIQNPEPPDIQDVIIQDVMDEMEKIRGLLDKVLTEIQAIRRSVEK